MRLSFFPVVNYAFAAALFALLLAAVWLAPVGGATPPRRRILRGIRLAVIVLVGLALLRPTLVYTTTRRQSATLVFLVDRSRSMLVADAFGDKTRWQALAATLDGAAPLREMETDLDIKAYAFDAQAMPLAVKEGTIEVGPAPDGAETAIGSCLEEILRREAGQRLVGVVLLSDGTQRAYAPRDIPPQVPARQLADLGFPLHTVVFGQTRGLGAARDVALEDLEVNDTVFVKNELSVAGRAKVEGFVNDRIPVELSFETAPGKMTVVAQTEILAQRDAEELPIELSYVPQVPGEYKVTLRAVGPPGELAPSNNELSTFVTVRKGGINVLYLEGAHPVEAKFLRRSLEASPDLRVEYLWLDPHSPQTRPGDFASRFQRGKYNVYLIGDLDSTLFQEEELAELVETVRGGAGLLMLGGLHSFGPGGYQNTPLAQLLPIKMLPLERQGADQPIAPDLHLAGPIKMLPTKTGEQLRMMLLGPVEQNQQLWDELPALEGANRFRGLAPGGNVLAESADAARAPLLVAQTFGNGRVLAFAGDSTWRWVLQGHEPLHKRFWRQGILWLAKKDQADEGNVWVRLDQRRFQPQARVEFFAGAQGPDGGPLTDVQFRGELLLPDGSRRPLRLSRQDDQFVGATHDTDAGGDYTIQVTATRNGEALGTAQARFLVWARDLELEKPVADPTLLASLAQMTGGEAMVPEQFSSFLEHLKRHPLTPLVDTQTKRTPWDTWPFFLAVTGLLCVEWWLRKRWGFV